MAATLRIYFMDLVAFVPLENKLWVLLPNGLGGDEVEQLQIPAHFPVLLFDTGVTNGGQWAEDELKTELGLTGDRRGTLWRLDREEIFLKGLVSLDPEASSGIEIDDEGENALEILPTVANVTSFSWVPRIGSVVETGQIDPDCISPKVETDKIVARLLLDRGTFRTSGFARIERPNIIGGGIPDVSVGKYEFRLVGAAPDGSEGRAIADLAVADLPLEGNSVEVEAVSFDNSERRSIMLSTNEGGTIEAVLANVSRLLSAEEELKEDSSRGPHFALYYRLAKEISDLRPIPHRVGEDSQTASIVQEPPEIIRELIEDRSSAFQRPVCALAQFTA